MTKTANLHIRVDPAVKQQVEELCSSMGMTITEAVNLFLHQALLEQGLPFRPHIPQKSVTEIEAEEVEDVCGKA